MIGIYCITNTVNHKKYIGQSWNIDKRIKKHFSTYCHNEHLKQSMAKYGKDVFKCQVLRTFNNHGLTQILLNYFEDFYIKQYNTMDKEYGYNKMEGGFPGKLCPESLEKLHNSLMGRVNSLEHRQKISQTLMGHYVSPETRYKQSLMKKGKNTGKRPPEWCRSISNGKKGCPGRMKTQEEKNKISASMKAFRAKQKLKREKV